MPPRWIVTVALVAVLLLAALVGVARVASEHPGAEPVVTAPHAPDPSLPTSVEANEAEPSASPALTR